MTEIDENEKISESKNQSIEGTPSPSPYSPLWRSCRLTFTICALISIVCNLSVRTNLNFAVICMTRTKLDNSQENLNATLAEIYLGEKILDSEKVRDETKGEFLWPKKSVGFLLGAFFYGYSLTQPFGGFLSDRYGGKFLLIFGLIVQGIVSLLFPTIARWNLAAVIVLRIFQGIVAGMCFSSVYQLFTKWALPKERSKLFALAYAGHPISTLLIFPLSAILCETKIDGGWPLVFYVPGAICFIAGIAFIWLIYNNCEEHPRITHEEYEYLRNVSTSGQPKTSWRSIPWNKICTSVPVYANIVANICQVWGFLTMSFILPQFIKEILYFDTKLNGVLSATPYISGLLTRIFISISFEPIFKRSRLSLTKFRKLNHFIGTFGPAAILVCVTFINSSRNVTILVLLAVENGLLDFGYIASFFPSYLELAPAYAGLLVGISNTLSTLSGVLSPNVTSFLTKNGTREEWNKVLITMAAIHIFGGLFYIVFGSSEPQEWGQFQDTKESKNDIDNKSKNNN